MFKFHQGTPALETCFSNKSIQPREKRCKAIHKVRLIDVCSNALYNGRYITKYIIKVTTCIYYLLGRQSSSDN